MNLLYFKKYIKYFPAGTKVRHGSCHTLLYPIDASVANYLGAAHFAISSRPTSGPRPTGLRTSVVKRLPWLQLICMCVVGKAKLDRGLVTVSTLSHFLCSIQPSRGQ